MLPPASDVAICAGNEENSLALCRCHRIRRPKAITCNSLIPKIPSAMKSFQILTLFALIAAAMAFAPNTAPKIVKDLSVGKIAVGAIPAAVIASPAFAMDSLIETLPTTTVALEVQFGAYLAVLLGTFLPCLFLVNLFVQTESRKAGKAGGQDSE